MPVTLTTLNINPKFTDEFTGSGGGGIDYLIGSIGDKITCDLQFDVWWNTLNVPMTFNAANKTITRQDVALLTIAPYTSTSNLMPSFIDDEFKSGDTITVAGSVSNNGSYTIKTITKYVITVVEDLLNETAASVSIYGDTPVTAIDYFFNLVENEAAENYTSLIDTFSSNRFNIAGITIASTVTAMNTVGKSKGWFDRQGATITGEGTASHIQSFLITHTFFITPLFLANWINNIQNKVNPNGFFADLQSLKYIAKINAKFVNTEVTPSHTSNIFSNFKDGNIGFYDEFLNGFDANYTLKSITYTDVLTALPVTNLQYGRDTKVEIHLTSVNGVFASGCKAVLNQIYCPLNETNYINTGQSDMINNFRFDRILLTEGSAAVNGEQYANVNRCITQAQAVLINANELKITYICSLSNDYNTFLTQKDSLNRNYLIFATPQNKAVTTTRATDRNAVICDTSIYTTDNTDDSLFKIIESDSSNDITFHSYPDEVMNDFTNANLFNNDYCLARGNFEVKTGIGATIKSLTFKIEAIKIYEDNIILEQYPLNLSSFTPDLNGVQQIDITDPTAFKVDANSIYDNYIIQRNPGLDNGDYSVYFFEYPFKIRYETWIALISKAYPNGTNDWASYQKQGWTIQFNIYAECLDANGNETDFLHTSYLICNSFDAQQTGIKATIETFNDDETINLDGAIDTTGNTVVVVTFKGNFISLPANTTDLIGILTIDSPDIGGATYSQSTSNVEPVLNGGVWLGYINDMAQLTQIDNYTIQVKGILDITKLNGLSGNVSRLNLLSLYGKIGFINDLNLLLQEDGTPILQEINDGIKL